MVMIEECLQAGRGKGLAEHRGLITIKGNRRLVERIVSFVDVSTNLPNA
jgi:hypothetical protein